VFCERVGGGFGGKQEMFVEDILALAAIKTGRPVKLELTREEQSSQPRRGIRCASPLRRRRRQWKTDGIAARRALQYRRLRQPCRPVLFHACGESLGVYNCPNKKVDAVVAYTNTVPSGAFRGYGLPQTLFAVEAAIDELGQGPWHQRLRIRRRNIVKPGDSMLSPPGPAHTDVFLWQLRARSMPRLVERAMQTEARRSAFRRVADREGIALTMIDTCRRTAISLMPGFRCARTAASNWSLAPPSSARHHYGASPDRGDRTGDHRQSNLLLQSDTAHGGHDTGAYGSAGTFVAGRATQAAAENLANDLRTFAATATKQIPMPASLKRFRGLRQATRVICSARGNCARAGTGAQCDRHIGGHAEVGGLQCPGLSRRREQGHRRDQDPESVHAADAGRVANPMQCRGQIEGGSRSRLAPRCTRKW